MSAIGPGDWVECVACDTYPHWVGQVFQVEAIGELYDCDNCGACCGLVLVNRPLRRNGGLWCTEAFRPIYRPRADFIESLKQPTPSIPEVEPA